MIAPSTPPELSRRLRDLDARLRIVFDERRECWRVDEHVGAWGKWSPVMYWRNEVTGEPYPIEGACDAIILKLRGGDWSKYGQRRGARGEVNRDIDGGASIEKRDEDEDRYRFNHHARDLYDRQMGHKIQIAMSGAAPRMHAKEKAAYLHQLAASHQRKTGTSFPR